MKERLAKIREAFEKVSIHSDATASPLCAYPLNEGFKALIELERLVDHPAPNDTAPCPEREQRGELYLRMDALAARIIGRR